jgi:hypothetical protein
MPAKSILSRLEGLLQSLVEGSAGRIFPARDLPNELANRLEEALHQGIQPAVDGEPLAPNHFTVLLPAALAQAAAEDALLRDELTRYTEQAAARLGCRFAAPPLVKILPHPEAEASQPLVLARHAFEELGDTTALEVENTTSPVEASIEAYLVVNGLQIFSLTQALISIGRDPQNTLVLDDERVSRLHAQLRMLHGQYFIFDLASTGGTFVNGQRVTRQALFPGDVISLAGVPLVYGQEGPRLAEQTEEIITEL